MKYTLILVAAVAAIFVGAPSSAQARDYCSGDRRIVGYSHSRPIYAVYQIVGYDHCGRPIGRWVTVSSYGGYRSPSRYSSHSGHYGSPYGHHSPYSHRSGLNLSFSFGR